MAGLRADLRGVTGDGRNASDAAAAAEALSVAPCSLVTTAEAEHALGNPIVANTILDPGPDECVYESADGIDTMLIRLMGAQSCGFFRSRHPNATDDLRADVGEGGVFDETSGQIQVNVGDGCFSIDGSITTEGFTRFLGDGCSVRSIHDYNI